MFVPPGVLQQQIAGGGGGDPYWSDVTLLMHFNGTDGSTTFTDSSGVIGSPLGSTGNVQIDTAQSKFGGASCLFTATNDAIFWTYDNATMGWYLEDYTLECWVYASSWSGWSGAASLANVSNLIGSMDGGSSTNYWSFGPVSSGKLGFKYYNGASVELLSSGTVPLDEWAHIAMTYRASDNTIRLFINGTLDGSAAVSGTVATPLQGLTIGLYNHEDIVGWVDDLRITKGTARYIGSFTAPTAEFPDS